MSDSFSKWKKRFIKFLLICLIAGLGFSVGSQSQSPFLPSASTKLRSSTALFTADQAFVFPSGCDCKLCDVLVTQLHLPFKKQLFMNGTCNCYTCEVIVRTVVNITGLLPSDDRLLQYADEGTVNDELKKILSAGAVSKALEHIQGLDILGLLAMDFGTRFNIDPIDSESQYSTVRCVGGKSYLEDQSARVCVMRDVCHVAGSAADFTVYVDDSQPPHPVYYDNNDIIPKVDSNLVMRGTYSYTQRWEMETVEGPRPTDFAYHPVSRAVAGHFQGGYHESLNFGHFVGDGLHAAFVAQVLTGRQPSLDTLLVDSPKADTQGATPFEKFWELARGVSKHPHIPDIRHADTICFKELIIGFGPLSFMYIGDVASVTAEPFRNWVMHNLDVHMPLEMKHKIVMLVKSMNPNVGRAAGRGRHVLNHDDVLAHVRNIFEKHAKIEVVSIEPDTISIKEQLELAASSTVLVTPPGGGSFLAWFLPPGASAIFLDVWGGLEGNAGQIHGQKSVRYHLDDNVWGRLNFITDMHYPVCTREEMVGDNHMDVANMMVVPARMAYMIWLALREAEERIPASVLPRAPLPELLPALRKTGVVCTIDKATKVFKMEE